MRKLLKSVVSVVTAVALTVSLIPTMDFMGVTDTVQAAESMLSDSTQITTNIVPDIQLCYALRQIIGGDKYANITVKDLRSYTGKIDLSVYSDYSKIESLEGLGYARKASGIDASKLTRVREIKDNEFQNCEFTTFGMPTNVVEIGKEAFFNCTNLEYVDLPDSLVTIHSEAFRNCKALDGIVLPERIAKIGNNAFAVCESLSSIVIPDGINAAIENASDESAVGLGGGVFDGCASLSSVKLGAGMTAIPAAFLANTAKLHFIDIPARIVRIMDGAFSGSGLISIDLSANTSITTIEESVFDSCAKLINVKLPKNIEAIEEAAFNSCVSLRDFSFVEQLTKLRMIGTSAFHACGFLEISVPETVEKIGNYAFAACKSLKKATIRDFGTVKGNLIKKIGAYAFSESHFLEEVVLPSANENNSQVTIEIDEYAFFKCQHLKKINFPANVTKIGSYAFAECGHRITKKDIENYGETLPIYTLVGLEEADMSKCAELTLGDHAFYKCVILKTVSLPEELTEIPNYAFAECSTPVLTANGVKVPDRIDTINQDWYIGLSSVKMGDRIQRIGDYAFYKDYNLVINGELPSALKTIGAQAYRYCESLTSVTLPRNIESIGTYAFANTSRMVLDYMSDVKLLKMDVSYANNLQYIGANAFQRSGIQSFIMDQNAPLTKLDRYTFSGCQYLDTVVLSKNVASIGSYALGICLRLKSLNVYDSCTFEKDAIKGGARERDFPAGKSTNKGYELDGEFYLSTYDFNLAITPLNDRVTVRLNEMTNLPLYTIAPGSGGYYSQVKISDNTYTYNAKNGALEGEQNPQKTNMVPMQVQIKHTVPANDYIKEYSTEAYAVGLSGLTEGRNIAVNVQEFLRLEIADNIARIYSPTATYIADVTGVPCVGIDVDDKQYVSVAAKKALTISPKFNSDNGTVITDEVEWEILTGQDYITMSVSEDGKSVSVLPKGEACGSASIRVKAGQVTKIVYVHVVAPASFIKFSPSAALDMMYGTKAEVAAAASYSSKYSDLANVYPDAIKFKSSNPNVVKIIETVDGDGKTTCRLSAVGAGSAVITAEAMAGGVSAKMNVYVSSDNLKLTLADGNGKTILTGDAMQVRTSNGVTYTYDFSESLGNDEVIVESSDESVIKSTATTYNKKITFRAYKTGKSQITVYPAVGAKKNGVSFTIYVNSDVTDIRLSSKSIPAGDSDSVFTSMRNAFWQQITKANATTFSSITDNKIKFTSSNPEYVSVDGYGKVTVKKYSANVKPVTITCVAYDKNGEVVKSASTTVTLQKPVVKSINITGSTTVNVGSTVKYKLAFVPAYGDYTRVTVSCTSGSYRTATYQLSGDYKTLTVKGTQAGTITLEISVKKGVTTLASKKLKVVVKKEVKAPAKVKWGKCKAGKKKVSLKWKKVSNAAGYEIQMSQKKNSGYKKVKTITSGKKLKYTVKKLKKKKKYYFRIRAFVRNSDGTKKYGKWSSKKKLKVK